MVPFLYYEGCDTLMVVVGVGQDVILEAVGVRGNVLGRAELENVFQQSFMLADKFPDAAGEYGTLRVSGKATALGLQMCDYPAPGEGPKRLVDVFSTHPIPGYGSPVGDNALPSGETFVIEEFATRRVGEEEYDSTVLAAY